MTSKTLFLPLIVLNFLFALNAIQAQQTNACNENYKTAGGKILRCQSKMLKLGTTKIEVRVYTKKPANLKLNKTFVVVHNDEQVGLNLVKELIAQKNGRLVEVVSEKTSDDHTVNKSRYLRFSIAGKDNVCIDPNRIYTNNGIIDDLQNSDRNDNDCQHLSAAEAMRETNIAPVRNFARQLQNIIQDKPRANYKFIISVHNNDAKGCLTFFAYDKNKQGECSVEEKEQYVAQTKKVLAAPDADTSQDDFLIVTTPKLFDALQRQKFNLILQAPKEKLTGVANDGSMSVYSAKNNLRYIISEAQCKNNESTRPSCITSKDRQRQMLETILRLP